MNHQNKTQNILKSGKSYPSTAFLPVGKRNEGYATSERVSRIIVRDDSVGNATRSHRDAIARNRRWRSAFEGQTLEDGHTAMRILLRAASNQSMHFE
jgi:hypothetical protein